MEAYLYSQHFGDSQLSLTDALIDVSDLASRGVVNQNSSVWVSAHSPRPDMWMLTDRSSYTYVHHSRTPGFVRISKTDLRWAADWNSTISNPSITLSTKEISAADDEDVNITFIVKHRVCGEETTVIKPDGRKGSMVDGRYTLGNFTVIDLPTFRPTPLAEADSYQKSHAAHMGAHHILRSIPRNKRGKISPYIDLMRFELSDDDMERLQEVHSQMRRISASLVDTLRTRFAERGAPMSLLTSEGATDG